MRILQIRLQNLNSLVGKWQIDLAHSAFAAEGLFAITGPTGAGKTTILDAICLALYGRTPRLEKVTASANEIMSRQTGSCFAEVTFETEHGRYCCHWSQHRARNKPNGKLQQPLHEISDTNLQQVLENKLSTVPKRVEAVCGMDFDRFTRSMLLAQGQFAAFLQADATDRAPILEQITGTEIYSSISKYVHERRGAEQKALEARQVGLAAIQPLSAEEEKQLRETLNNLVAEDAEVTKRVEARQRELEWLQQIEQLERQLATNKQQMITLAEEQAAFAPQRERLQRAQQALELDGEHASLVATRNAERQDQQKLKKAETAIATQKAQAAKVTAAYDAAVAAYERRKIEQREAQGLVRHARDADQLLRDWRDVGTELANVAAYTRDLRNAIGTVATGEAELAKLAERQRELSLKRTRVAEQLAQAADELQTKRAECDRLQTEHEQLQRIATYEQARGSLEDGSPCPLCGSTTHPYVADGSVKVDNATATRLQTALKALNTLQKQLSALQIKQAECEKDIEHAAETQTARKKAITKQRSDIAGLCADWVQEVERGGLAKNLAQLQQRTAELAETISHALHERQETATDGHVAETGAIAAVYALVQQRHAALGCQHSETAQRIGDIREEIGGLRIDAAEAGVETSILENLDAMEQAVSAWLGVAGDLREAGDYKKVLADIGKTRESELDAAVDRFTEAVEAADSQRNDAQKKQTEIELELRALDERCQTLRQSIATRSDQLKREEAAFVARLAEAGFAEETIYLAACLPEQERKRLSKQAETLAERRVVLDTAHRELAEKLAAEREQPLTDRSRLELVQQRDAAREQQSALQQQVGAIRQQLQEDARQKQQRQEQAAALDAQKREYARWDALHDLIGSADGKKYRNFAQALTFEIMVSHANRQLQKMTDRYLLLRDPERLLELTVIDNYQAGEMRSTQNLSGGESFMVSLALAVGLSQMASQKVRVDSLFLDEGFGSLDAEALDTALDMLATLRNEGKSIGIISHVPAINERIDLQIQIVPHTGGRSKIVGPGCVRESEVESTRA